MNIEQSLEKDLIDICKLMYNKDLISATDGNLSIKIDNNRLITTPSGINKGLLTEDKLLITDFDGKVIKGSLKASSELKMHVKIYQDRPDVNAVIHSHSPFATSFALAGFSIKSNYLIETLLLLGDIAIAPYATPSTDEVAKSIDGLTQKSDAILLKNHGVVTYGKDIYQAFNRLDALENVAKTIIFSHIIGGPQEISCDMVDLLKKVREKRKTR